ncbi:MAG TPA: prolyl oligopeptidase family serine peptidase [Jatrophihabitans sp.]|nr:prolyl oligopeptidase family serine peptidase [Jatrophihabitans sp.]
MTVAPYGTWASPITAADLAAGGHPVGGGRFVGEEIWWLESRADQRGRQAVRRLTADGTVADVLAEPWNARTRVQEYGGGSWLGLPDGRLVFTEFTDQRLYLLPAGATEPAPLTPEQPWRYAEPQLSRDGTEIWCVREAHAEDGTITRDLAAVPLDGSAVADPRAVRSILGGSDFLAQAQVSPDGSRIAWIAWNHPQMPWDGTELRVGTLGPDGTCTDVRTLIGSPSESVLQPEWAGDDSLYALSDRTGWWNLYRVSLAGQAEPLCPREEEFGGPMWVLGSRWYSVLGDGRLLVKPTFGSSRVAVLDPADGSLTPVPLADAAVIGLGAVAGDGAAEQVLLTCSGARRPGGLRRLVLATGELTDIRLNVDTLPDERYLARPAEKQFAGPDGRVVHAIDHPPTNPDHTAPDGELPPYVVMVHGGPTSQSVATMSLDIAYFTSRGIGVLDVNYGGSTGYGRAYRDRLKGQWGVVDVEDTIAAIRGLVAEGSADPARLAITGGSAGGFTVLAALTGTDVFACGTSYFGVADLMKMLEHTHDFESQYLFGLVGPLPEDAELYRTRSPLHNVAGLSCPVLLLQGLEDPVVPPEQAELFRDALVAKGIPHAYLAFPEESHGFRQAKNQIASQEAELSFYGQVFGFTPPGVPELELSRPAG